MFFVRSVFMSGKYHFNKLSGETGLCHATVQSCPLGLTEDQHYRTQEEAKKGYENYQKKMMLSNRLSKPKKIGKYKMTILSGAMITTVALTGCSDISQSIDQAQNTIDNISSSSSSTNSDRDPQQVYFQGKSITPTPEEVTQAKNELSSLIVAPENTAAGDSYHRAEQFGRSFQTGVVGRLEHRDVTNGQFKNDAPQSRAIGGNFVDPYSGDTVEIVKGSKTDTDVDHIVPLKEVYESGGDQWTQDKRVSIANDPENLQIVSSHDNRSKSDKDASEYIPSYEPAQCKYIIAQINIKTRYQLTVDNAEEKTMQEVLNTRC